MCRGVCSFTVSGFSNARLIRFHPKNDKKIDINIPKPPKNKRSGNNFGLINPALFKRKAARSKIAEIGVKNDEATIEVFPARVSAIEFVLLLTLSIIFLAKSDSF